MAMIGTFIEGSMSVINASVRALMENEESVPVLQSEQERLGALFQNVVRMSTAFPQLQELEGILQKLITDIRNQGPVSKKHLRRVFVSKRSYDVLKSKLACHKNKEI